MMCVMPLWISHATVMLNAAQVLIVLMLTSGKSHSYSEMWCVKQTLLNLCFCSHTSGGRCVPLPTAVSIELGSLEMVCSLYSKSQRPSEALGERSALEPFLTVFVRMCLNVSLEICIESVEWKASGSWANRSAVNGQPSEVYVKHATRDFKLVMKQSQFNTEASVWPTSANTTISNTIGCFCTVMIVTVKGAVWIICELYEL